MLFRSTSFFVPANTNTLLLSDITELGNFPLQGNSGTDKWYFEIPSTDKTLGTHDLTIEAIAILGTDKYGYASDTVTLVVHPKPTATLSAVGSTHICTGTNANFSVALTGTGPWTITYTDGTTPVTYGPINSSPYTFSKVHTANKTWTISNVSDAYCSNTGTGSVKIYIGTLTYVGVPRPEHPCEGSFVSVPIKVRNFEDVGVISLTLNYDASVLEYNDYTPPVTGFGNFTVDGDIDGVIKAGGWSDPAAQFIDDSTFFVLKFIYKGGSSRVNFDTINPASCEYISGDGSPFCDFPAKFYYQNLNPILSGYLRPKAAVSGNSTICKGKETTFSVMLTGGQPWTFKWSDGTNETEVSGITTSSYSVLVSPNTTTTYTPVSVSDVNGCSTIVGDLTGSAKVTVNELPIVIPSKTDVTCNGANDGKIDLAVTGAATLTYSWYGTPSGGYSSTAQNISGLKPATYMVTVTDGNTCVTKRDAIITEPNILGADVASTNVTCNGASDGTITITNPTGGYLTYQ